ncbi:MAG TPA: hypothetical protein VKU60_13595, partial [Chloroflexota bacterium]|nr:hypothetical protein [Chloroflexota bacterium]
ALVPVAGVSTFQDYTPSPAATAEPAPGYGDFGAPGNPYGPDAVDSPSPAQAGAFSDQQPAGSSTQGSGPYTPLDLNGGSRGFPAYSLTVNQTLPAADAS